MKKQAARTLLLFLALLGTRSHGGSDQVIFDLREVELNFTGETSVKIDAKELGASAKQKVLFRLEPSQQVATHRAYSYGDLIQHVSGKYCHNQDLAPCSRPRICVDRDASEITLDKKICAPEVSWIRVRGTDYSFDKGVYPDGREQSWDILCSSDKRKRAVLRDTHPACMNL